MWRWRYRCCTWSRKAFVQEGNEEEVEQPTMKTIITKEIMGVISPIRRSSYHNSVVPTFYFSFFFSLSHNHHEHHMHLKLKFRNKDQIKLSIACFDGSLVIIDETFCWNIFIERQLSGYPCIDRAIEHMTRRIDYLSIHPCRI